MAGEVGAGLVQIGGIDSIHVAGVSPKNPASGQPSAVLSHAIGINKLGRRFIDESVGYVAFGKAIIDQPGGEAALVFDQAMAEAPPGKSVIDQYTHFKLDIIKTNTLEELAGRIGCPPAALVETVAKFNAAVQGTRRPRPPRPRTRWPPRSSGRHSTRFTRSNRVSLRPSAACGSTRAVRCWRRTARLSGGCMRPEKWRAAFSRSTISAAAPCVAA